MPDQTHGDLIRLDRTGRVNEEVLQRIPLGTPVSAGGIDESFLQDLLFRYPRSLPIAAIDAAYSNPVPICRELYTSAGYIDALYINPLGRLILAEFKLWRNPQARREVIGQILDYTKELASWNYEDLQREVSRALKRKGNVPFELVHAQAPGVDEAEFVDNVVRHLRRGEFLLLIIGDGIREGVENIVDFVQRHSGLHFNLALVEAALYRDRDDHVLVQPRVLTRTTVVRRVVVEGRDVPPDETDDDDAALPEYQQENVRFWTAVLDDYAFSDVTVEVPEVVKDSVLYVKVRHSGFGDWGLSFVAYLYRSESDIGCYLTRRRGIQHAVEAYQEVKDSLDELREDLGGLLYWEDSAGRPRIGFRRRTSLPFPPDDGPDGDFGEAVAWMRDCLDSLVSTLHPRLQRLISAQD